MPVKILLADKSITIQKVVEMLFSGKEYEVTCVSDGETALSEAGRILPNVVLADVDLPRLDGYGLAARLRETPALGRVPVILMLSRDDQYDAARGRQSGIIDSIAKPFESQELIGKVKKALTAAPPSAAAPVSAAPAAPAPKPAAPAAPVQTAPPRPAAPPPPSPKQAVPKDIFSIIEEAPAAVSVPAAPAAPAPKPAAVPPPAPREEIVEVEPEIEVEPEFEVEPEPAMPAAVQATSAPAVTEEIEAEIVPESTAPVSDSEAELLFGKAPAPQPAPTFEPAAAQAPQTVDFSEPLPTDAESALPLGARAMEEMREGLGLGGPSEEDVFGGAGGHPDIVSFESLDIASRVSHEEYAPPVSARAPAPPAAGLVTQERAAAPPPVPVQPPVVTEEMLAAVVQKTAREVLERVAWEVIPDLAERLIRDEIERLKAGS